MNKFLLCTHARQTPEYGKQIAQCCARPGGKMILPNLLLPSTNPCCMKSGSPHTHFPVELSFPTKHTLRGAHTCGLFTCVWVF